MVCLGSPAASLTRVVVLSFLLEVCGLPVAWSPSAPGIKAACGPGGWGPPDTGEHSAARQLWPEQPRHFPVG